MNALFLVILATFLGSGVSVLLKLGLHDLPPLLLTFARFGLALLVFLPFYLWQRQKAGFSDLKVFIPVSVLPALNIIFFIIGLQGTSASIAQSLYAGVPILTAIISYFLLGERFTARKIFGALVGFLGVLVIVLLPAIQGGAAFNGNLFSNLLIFVGVVSFSVYTVICKKMQNRYSPFLFTFFFVLTSTIISLALLVFENHAVALQFSFRSWMIILYVSIVGTCLFYFLYQKIIKTASPLVASTILYLQPVFTVLLAMGILGERPTPGFYVGGILALCGVALVTSRK